MTRPFRLGILMLGSAAVMASAAIRPHASAQERAVVVPAPVVDEAAGGRTSETAILAGGCFWGVQGVYQHVKGVTMAVSGYAGGSRANAAYGVVGSGRTGHAESVRVTFDPRQISYGRILQLFFSVVHDPTQLDRQGPDVGPQYRSTIFPIDDEQERIAKAYVAQLGKAGAFGRPIVTTVETGQQFFPAEAYHQDYLARNPTAAYIAINDIPKIENLERLFPGLYRAVPVLVGSIATE